MTLNNRKGGGGGGGLASGIYQEAYVLYQLQNIECGGEGRGRSYNCLIYCSHDRKSTCGV